MQKITTVMTTVPTGQDEGPARMRQLAGREQDLAAHGRAAYSLHTTQVITGVERTTFVDTLTRDDD